MENISNRMNLLEQAMITLIKYNKPLVYCEKILKKYRSSYTLEDLEDIFQEICYMMCKNMESTINAYLQHHIWIYFIAYAKLYIRNWACKQNNRTDCLDSIEEMQEKEQLDKLSNALVSPVSDAEYDAENRLYFWTPRTKGYFTPDYIIEHAVQWDWNRMMLRNWISENSSPVSKYVNQYMTEKEKRAFIHLYAANISVQETNLFEKYYNETETTKAEYKRVWRHIQNIKNNTLPKRNPHKKS